MGGRMDELMDGWMDGCIDGWMDGWMEWQMDGLMDVWMGVCVCVCVDAQRPHNFARRMNACQQQRKRTHALTHRHLMSMPLVVGWM